MIPNYPWVIWISCTNETTSNHNMFTENNYFYRQHKRVDIELIRTRIKRNILLIAITHNLSLSLLPFRSPKILHECFQINSSIERSPWAREHRRSNKGSRKLAIWFFLLRAREDFVIRNREERKSIEIHHKVLEKLIGAWNFITSCQSNKFRFSRTHHHSDVKIFCLKNYSSLFDNSPIISLRVCCVKLCSIDTNGSFAQFAEYSYLQRNIL